MTIRYAVVDGSNIATEGRSIPSLAQLDEAVRAFMSERPAEQVIVVVDASFGYRIDESERKEYEQAEVAGEIVSPPAGAVGRGDGFLLRIADRTDAVVLSNDSFQEFHAEYPWLFDEGRLIGGKPVPGVGWIFTPRSPVRGPRSREVMRAHKKAQKAALKRAAVAEGPLADAIATATAEAISGDDGPVDDTVDAGDAEDEAKEGKRARRRRAKPAGTVNDPLPFIEFIAEHPLGSEVEGEVETFTSHGAFVRAGGARCYVPLVALGDPPPRSAKSVLKRGQPHAFVVQALDPPRRGIELALPGVARVAGTPTEETVEADIGAGRKKGRAAAVPEPLPDPVVEAVTDAVVEAAVEGAPERAPAKRARKAAKRKEAAPVATEAMDEAPEPVKEAAKVRRAKKAAVKEEAAAKKPGRAKKAAPRETGLRGPNAVAGLPGPDPMAGSPPEPQPEPEPVLPAKARRATKKAAAAAAEAEPAKSAKSTARKKKAAAPVIEPQPEPAPAKPRRSTKKAASEPAKKATRKKSEKRVAAET